MGSSVRDVVKRALPQRYLAHRERAHRRRLRIRRGMPGLASRFVAEHGLTILHGPFAGVEYPDWLVESDTPIAKLLGSYELELHEAIERVIADEPPSVIDIGAAEGYYAVGLACRLPATRIIAFELDPTVRRKGEELARRNGVAGRIEWRGRCTAARLKELDLDGAFVLSDCEGAEVEIFSALPAESLLSTTLLIELHEETYAGVDLFSTLRSRLEATHDALRIAPSQRRPDYPELGIFSEDERALALAEFRGSRTPWGMFTARQS